MTSRYLFFTGKGGVGQVIGSYRGLLPEAVLASIEEQLSGACTVEIAAFGLFTGLLTDPGTVG